MSRTGAVRLIGYSPTAGFVITVIIDPVDWAGVTAWKTRGADLRSYLGGKEANEMTDRTARGRRDAIRAEYAAEEAEAAEAEAVEAEQAVLSVRIPAHLAETLKTRAAAEHIPVSALVRRVLSRGVLEPAQPVLTLEQVEEIARRVVLETGSG